VSLWDIVDLDKFMNYLLGDVGSAIHGWINGRPLDEVALMNRLTEALAKRRRGCDIGIDVPVIVNCRVVLLHRQGIRQTDQYGSDLAVTVYTEGGQYIKTVFLQLKRSQDLSASLERQQLHDALLDHRVADRAFVLAVDDVRQCIRLQNVRQIYSQLPANQATCVVSTQSWQSLTRWVTEWLECSLGPASDSKDPNSIESLLEAFVKKRVTHTPWAPSSEHDLPNDILPARAWLQAEFVKKHPER